MIYFNAKDVVYSFCRKYSQYGKLAGFIQYQVKQ